MKVTNLHELMVEELQDLVSAEHQIIKAMPKMIEKATTPELKEGLKTHLEETKAQAERIVKLCEDNDIDPKGEQCFGIEGLLKDGEKVIEDGEPGVVLDIGMIGGARKVEHYEILGYTAAIDIARQMGHDEIAQVLEETLKEERATDVKLEELCQKILPDAPTGM